VACGGSRFGRWRAGIYGGRAIWRGSLRPAAGPRI